MVKKIYINAKPVSEADKEKIKKDAKEIKEQLSQENDLKTITKSEPMMKIKAVASRMRRAIKQVLYKNKETQSGDVR